MFESSGRFYCIRIIEPSLTVTVGGQCRTRRTVDCIYGNGPATELNKFNEIRAAAAAADASGDWFAAKRPGGAMRQLSADKLTAC